MDKKESLETKLKLDDEQLDNVGGGFNPTLKYYGYCYECGWKSEPVRGKKVWDLVNEHICLTGHTDVKPRIY